MADKTDSADETPYEPGWFLGVTAQVLATVLIGLATSGLFAFHGWWKLGAGLGLLAAVLWLVRCMRASHQSDRSHKSRIAQLEAELKQARTAAQTAGNEAAKEHRSAVANAVGSMFWRLQDIVKDPQEDPDGKIIVRETLEALAKLMGGKDPRTILYKPVFIDDDGDPDSGKPGATTRGYGPPSKLQSFDYRGRTSDPPRREFLREDDPDHGMISVFDTGKPQKVRDTSEPKYRIVLKDKQYKTFINVRTDMGDVPYGVLSVDSCEANSLDEGHENLMQVFGRLLAVGIYRQEQVEDKRSDKPLLDVRARLKPGDL
ncbi:hypothetical protein NQ038_05555 [Brevibacterium sp. 50QC2O2]|uniref:hypothetical protein n=1 Tax=Brevibacterium sp. 50QC2O2 TaxID=2968459 RepID=UPI00211C671E|nr:hypothetical protein [Brevibacterium sp. 50QC2O2]MCQ9388110.1 hypothetical protein [Brevibacterium sp. 50QC2O2]